MNLDTHILKAIQARPAGSRAMTINDLSREFGVTPFTALAAARRLVEDDLVAPSMINVHGVPTLHGLVPLPVAQASPDLG